MKNKKVEALSQSYLKLLKELKELLIQGLKIIEEQRAKIYWQTGRSISEYVLENKQHGDGLFSLLSRDLGINERTLYHSVQFYEAFPNLTTWSNLTWSHFKLLLGVEDKQKRNFFQKQAIGEDWSVEQLQNIIRLYKLQLKELTQQPPEPQEAPKLSFTRGRLYTYRLIKPEWITPESTEILIDCGFDFWEERELKGLKDPEDGQIVESVKTESGYKFKTSEVTKKHLYTYKAFIESVIDADTIWVNIDLGFKNWARQKLRFRGIDASELSTKKGERAKEFVEATLSKVSYIIIRSTSLDKYGRPLSDIFYQEEESDPQKVLEEGIFLNQELLDYGLAKLI